MTDRPTIHGLVVEAMQECGDPHPRVVADAMIDALPKSRYVEALRESMWLFVRSVSEPREAGVGRPHAEASAHVGRMGAAVSLAWLRQRVSVAPGVYKFMGECTAEDLDVLARVRQEHAKSNAEAADRYERLAHLMREAKAERLADLPDDVLGGES